MQFSRKQRRWHRNLPEISRLRHTRAKTTPRTYLEKIRSMMKRENIEWIACVSAASGHSPYGILRMSRLLEECV